MIDPKNVVVFAAVGFVLSLFVCLVSSVAFPVALLRAFIWTLVFGAIGVGVQVLFKKFLLVGGSSFSGATETKPSAVGGSINISVGDDNLPDEEVAPKFIVSNTRPGLGAANLSKYADEPVKVERTPVRSSAPASEPAAESAPSDSAARPPSAKEDAPQAAAPSEKVPPSESAFKPVGLESVTKKSDSLDDLPDIGDFSASADVPVSENPVPVSSDSFSDSSFSGSGSSGSALSSGDRENAELMAKAISTLLAKDN